MKQRIAYYDVMKGILICLVIFHHIVYETTGVSKIPNETFHWLGGHIGWYACFFMPAFFLITGICSSFNKPFFQFLVQNLKTILLPGLFFDLLFYTLPRMLESGAYSSEILDFFLRFKSLGGYFWFLVSLFLAKLFYWGINKLPNPWLKWISLGLCCLLGFVIKHYNLVYNHWSICQALDLTPFLAIGQALKNSKTDKNLLYGISLMAFVATIAVFYGVGLRIPHVTAVYNIREWWQLPVHVFLATFGSMTMLFICQKIGTNRILEYLGQGSLVIYMMHSFVIKFLLNRFGYLLDGTGTSATVALFILMFFIVTTVTTVFVWLFQQKYLRVLVGKW